MTTEPPADARSLMRRGRLLEAVTLAWNVVGVAVLAVAAYRAGSVALAGFGLDSLIEIGASTVVLWELACTGEQRQRRALGFIGAAFAALAVYLLIQTFVVLAANYRPAPSSLGIAWTAVTAGVMFALAAGKTQVGHQLGNPVPGQGRTRHRHRRTAGAGCAARAGAQRSAGVVVG